MGAFSCLCVVIVAPTRLRLQEGRMPLNWRRRHWRQRQRGGGSLGSPLQGEGQDGRPRLLDMLEVGGGERDGGAASSTMKGRRGGPGPALGIGEEEALVLKALRAYRDLLGRPQRGSPGRLVLRPITLLQVLCHGGRVLLLKGFRNWQDCKS